MAAHDGGAAHQQGRAEQHLRGEAPAHAQTLARRRLDGGPAEIKLFVFELLGRAIAEGLNAAEDEADIGARGEGLLHREIMPRRDRVVVVEEMHEIAAGERQREIAHHRGNAACRLRVEDILDPPVVDRVDRPAGGAFGTVVDHEDFHLDAILREHARHGLAQRGGAAKGGNDDGNVHGGRS